MSTHTSDEVESNKAMQTSMSTQNDTNAVLDCDTVDQGVSSQSAQVDTTSVAIDNTPTTDDNPSSNVAKDEFEQSLTKTATAKGTEGLEQLPSDVPTADPSTIFDDSLEKKENENSRRGIEQLADDNDGRPALDPRIVYDDSLDKVREKQATAAAAAASTPRPMGIDTQTSTNVNVQSRDHVHQGENSTNIDDFVNNSNALEQGINLEEELSQRDTLGQLSQTQRRHGANNNTLDVEPGRGRRDELQLSSTIQGRSLAGRIANSLFPRIYHDSETLVEATLVVEDDLVMGEIVEARRVGFCARNWKAIGVALVCILIIFAVLLSVSLATHNRRHPDMTYEPSAQPSAPPSFDQRPTFDIVRERGNVRCGVSNGTITISGGRILHLVSACLVICIFPCISLCLTIHFYYIFIGE